MSSFPPPPVTTIDWNTLGFDVTEVFGHIESSYSVESGHWSAPRIVTDPYLRIHGLCPGLNYGLQAFEGIKAYRTPSNRIAIFRPQKNSARFERSAAFIAIPPIPQNLFLDCVRLAVGANAAYVAPHETGAALYIRPVIFGTAPQISLSPPKRYLFCVYVTPTGTYHGSHPQDSLILEDFDRAAPEGTGSVKIGGNYAPVFRFSQDARAEGFGITLHLDSKTRREIDEFTTSGFIGVKVRPSDHGEESGLGHVTLVVPDSKNVVESITSASACEIGASWGWTVDRRSIPYTELGEFDEVIAAGTAATLVPIRSITMRKTGDCFVYRKASEGPGPVMLKLLKELKGIQMGKVEDRFGWLDYVEDPGLWTNGPK